MSIRPRRSSREPFIAVAELTGSAAKGRIVLAAPIALAEIEARFADRIENRDEVTFDEKSLSLRARRSRRLGAIALTEQTRKVEPNDDTARLLAEGIARVGIDKLPWTKSLTQWRDRVMFLRKAEGDEWPDLSDAALAANVDWLVPAFADKMAVSQLSPDDLQSALTELLPWPLRRRLDAEAPTHFEAPTGTNAAIDYEAEAGPDDLDPPAGTVRPCPAPEHRGRTHPAGAGAAVARTQAGADHARPAGLLARLLCGGAHRDARALSAPSLAGRSARRAPTRRAKPRGT